MLSLLEKIGVNNVHGMVLDHGLVNVVSAVVASRSYFKLVLVLSAGRGCDCDYGIDDVYAVASARVMRNVARRVGRHAGPRADSALSRLFSI